jgi:hypothetical protein
MNLEVVPVGQDCKSLLNAILHFISGITAMPKRINVCGTTVHDLFAENRVRIKKPFHYEN